MFGNSYNLGRWGVFKNSAASEPIGLFIDGTGVPIAPGGPVFSVTGDRLLDPQGVSGPLAQFRETEWAVNHGDYDQTYVLRRI
jgi:hypothetical protein